LRIEPRPTYRYAEDETSFVVEDLWYKPAPDRYGSLAVSSFPPGANVFLDGRFRGTTPTRLKGIPYGLYTLRLEKRGYFDHSQRVHIYGDTAGHVVVTMRPEGRGNTLEFELRIPSPFPPLPPLPSLLFEKQHRDKGD
jgi:hypothetical protein